MIQLNDLRKQQKELIEVPNDELRSVVGGGDLGVGGVFPTPIVPPSVDIPIGAGFGVTLPTSGSIPPEYILQVPQLNYDIGKGSTISATGDGTFGVTVKKGPTEVTASGNSSTGQTALRFGIRF